MARISKETLEKNRRRLLEAAAEAFAEHGLAGANINAISVQAGLAKGTVYNYFASKEALFLAVVQEAFSRMETLEPPGDKETTRERLLALMTLDISWVKAYEGFAKVFVRESFSANPRFYPQILEAALPFIQAVQEALDRGVRRGEVRDDVPTAELALWFAGMGDLALLQHWGTGGGWPALDEIPELVVRQFLEGAGQGKKR